MFETIQKMVAEHLSISVDKVKPESDFITDLEADSLDIVEMLIAMENTFDIEFEDSEMVDIKTVQENLGHATASFTMDVYGHVSQKMKQQSAARMEQYIQGVSNNLT